MGEDVGAEGGVFKTNNGLIDAFGPERVRTTPICENGFVGVALGMSLVGLRPVVEIMFADFLPTAGDAIVNQLPKYRFMSGGQCAVPVTLRVIARRDRPLRDAALGDVRELVHATCRGCGSRPPRRRAPPIRCCERRSPTTTRSSSSSTRRSTGGRARSDRGEVAEVGKADVVRARPGRHDRRHPADGRAGAGRRRRARRRGHRGRGHRPALAASARPADGRASVERTGRLVVAEEQVHAAGWGATVISRARPGGMDWKAAAAAGEPARRLPHPVHAAARGPDRAVGDGIADAARAAAGR